MLRSADCRSYQVISWPSPPRLSAQVIAVCRDSPRPIPFRPIYPRISGPLPPSLIRPIRWSGLCWRLGAISGGGALIADHHPSASVRVRRSAAHWVRLAENAHSSITVSVQTITFRWAFSSIFLCFYFLAS